MRERFTATPAPATGGADVRIALRRAGRVVVGGDRASLLATLEAAGEQPAYGCRMGICNSCTCRKVTGSVRNTVTGAVSSEPNQDIRLCVSTPLSDLELDA